MNDSKTHPNTETIELLRRTLDLLAGSDKKGSNLARVEEAHSFTASGIGCEAWDETAARWTITGALAKFAMAPIPWPDLHLPKPGSLIPRPVMLRNELLFDGAFRHLFAAAVLQAPQTVNGVNNRGWDAVRDLIELAILLADNQATIMPVLALPKGSVPSLALRKRLEQIAQASGAEMFQRPS
jgi:hypothetical protein